MKAAAQATRVRGVCSIEGCDKPERTRTWCAAHYTRYLRHGDPLAGGITPSPKGSRTCKADGCSLPVHARDLCGGHYKREQAGSTATGPLRQLDSGPLAERLSLHAEADPSGCWLWTGVVDKDGYGNVWDGSAKRLYAHRASYEHHVGPIPDGLTLDHTCHTNDPTCPGGGCIHRRCVNPAHLEPVTLDENKRRGRSVAAVNARKTHCIHGHEFTPENTFTPSGGGRGCRTCKRERDRRRYYEVDAERRRVQRAERRAALKEAA